MNTNAIAIIVQSIAAIAPYLAQLGVLATKTQIGEVVTETDLQQAEKARKEAFTALRASLIQPTS